MGQKGYISEFVNGGRIVSHGKINDLSSGFRLPGDIPFSDYARPKSSTSDIDIVLSVRCSQDSIMKEAPVALCDWSPMQIVEIAPDNKALGTVDLYWGAGTYVEGE